MVLAPIAPHETKSAKYCGVNGSKNIVVINTDAEAPFFKAANYGVVGDAFTVVPRLIEAIKKYKN